MDTTPSSLETLQDIRRMMERSSRFISLSGLSGISAGFFALAGAFVAHGWLAKAYMGRVGWVDAGPYLIVKQKCIILAAVVLLLALVSSFYFTWNKARKNNLPIWDHASKKLLVNLAIPLVTGGLFISGMLYHNIIGFVAPACLIFYGLALVNASKFTLSDIRTIGLLEILLGLVNTYYTAYSLYFWAAGFGLLHIIYGWIMWRKYDAENIPVEPVTP